MLLYSLITSLSRPQKRLAFFIFDIVAIPGTLLLAILLNISVTLTPDVVWSCAILTVVMVCVGASASWVLGLPRIQLNDYEIHGIIRTGLVALVTGASALAANTLFPTPLAEEVLVIFTMIFGIASVSWRILFRQVTIWAYRRGRKQRRVIVYGAGKTGQQLAAALRTDSTIKLVAFVDDNPMLQSMFVAGLSVCAPSELKSMILRGKVDRIILAMPSTSPND